MASETADFYLRLHEEVNAPAQRARLGVRQLSGGLVATQRELARTESALASYYRRLAAAPGQHAAKQAADRKSALSLFAGGVGGGLFGGTAGSVLGGLAGGGLGPLGALAAVGVSATTSIIDGARTAAAAVADLAVGFVKTTGSALDFGQRSRLAFGALTGDTALGAQTFDEVRREAQGLGLAVHGTVDSYRQLLAAQFSVAESKELMRASSDLQAIGTDAEHIKLALLAISQIKMKGVLQAEEMRQLVNTGVSAELIYNALAKSLGKTRAEVLKMQAAREITSDAAINAFKTAIKEKTHEENLGDTGRFFAQHKISGQLAQARGAIENWFIDLGQRIEPTATRVATRAFGLFEDIAASPRVAHFSDTIVDSFENVASWLDSNWPAIASTVTNGVDVAASAASGTLEFMKLHWDEIRYGISLAGDTARLLARDVELVGSAVTFVLRPVSFLAEQLAAARADLAQIIQLASVPIGVFSPSAGAALSMASVAFRADANGQGDRDAASESRARVSANEAARRAGLANAESAGAALPGGKVVHIGSVSMPITVEGQNLGNPGGVADEIERRMQQRLAMMFEEAS